jgi:hypothetical protein
MRGPCGEPLEVLGDAVVIGDGGDFVSFAGEYVEPGRPSLVHPEGGPRSVRPGPLLSPHDK